MAYYPYAVEKGAIYTLTGPDGTVAVFNDPLDPNYVGMLTDVAGLDSAEVRESAEELTEADGGSHGYFYFARRPVVLTSAIFGHASVAERNLRIDRARRASNAMRGDAILSWKPSTRTENLLQNPGFELNTNGYTLVAGSGVVTAALPVRTQAYAHSGTWSVLLSATHDATATAAGHPVIDMRGANSGFNKAPVTPGKSYTGSYYMNITDAAGSASGARLRIYWYQADGTTLSAISQNTTGGYQPVSAVALIRPTVTAVAPADAAFAGLYIEPLNTWTNPSDGFTAYIDSFMINEGASALPFVNGDSPGMYWQGDPYASRSGDYIEMFTTLRRQQRFTETGAWVKEIQLPMVSEYATLFSTGLKSLTGSPIVCENRGSYVSYPIIEISNTSVNPRVTSSTLGGDFRTTGLTLAATETVQFDMLNHTGVFTAGARNGQSANRYIDFSLTKWIGLPGNSSSTLTLTGGGVQRAIWRDVWA